MEHCGWLLLLWGLNDPIYESYPEARLSKQESDGSQKRTVYAGNDY
jgi:hypothetical protein